MKPSAAVDRLPHHERIVGEAGVRARLGGAEDRREPPPMIVEHQEQQQPVEVVREAAVELAHAQSSRVVRRGGDGSSSADRRITRRTVVLGHEPATRFRPRILVRHAEVAREHLARDRRRRRAAVLAGVLDQHRDRDLGIVDRREGDEPGVVALLARPAASDSILSPPARPTCEVPVLPPTSMPRQPARSSRCRACCSRRPTAPRGSAAACSS